MIMLVFGYIPSRFVYMVLNRVEDVQFLLKAIVPLMDSVVPVSGGTTASTERYYRSSGTTGPFKRYYRPGQFLHILF